MVQIKTEFVDFYEEAVRCVDLDRGVSVYNPTWVCKKTGEPCGPGDCPRHPWLRGLMPKMEPKAKPEIPEVENEIAEMSSELALERVKPVGTELSSDQDSEKLVWEETSPKISSRNHAKSKTRAHTKKSILKRVTVTFIEKKTKQLQRWGLDLVFAQKNRKTSILAFRRGSGVRFYFGKGVNDEAAKQCVGSWFGSLNTHDPQAVVNVMGPPSPFSVDILDEA